MALQFLLWIDEAFVAPGNIVVHFNAKDVAFLGVADDLFRVVALQAIGPDAHVVSPVLAGRELLGEAKGGGQNKSCEHQRNARGNSCTWRSRHRTAP